MTEQGKEGTSKGVQIPILRKWMKIVLPNGKSIFYNKSDDTVTVYPPFPKAALDMFLSFYQFGISSEDLNALIKEQLEKRSSGAEKNEKLKLTPITDEAQINQLISVSKIECFEKVVQQAWKMKFNVIQQYEYTSKDPNVPQSCVVKIKQKSLVQGEVRENKAAAKEYADKTSLKMLIPINAYNAIIKNIEERQKIEEEEEKLNAIEKNDILSKIEVKKKNEAIESIKQRPKEAQKKTNQKTEGKEIDLMKDNSVLSTSRVSKSSEKSESKLLNSKRPREKESQKTNNNSSSSTKQSQMPKSLNGYEEEIVTVCTNDSLPMEEMGIDDPKIVTDFLETFTHTPSNVRKYLIKYNRWWH